VWFHGHRWSSCSSSMAQTWMRGTLMARRPFSMLLFASTVRCVCFLCPHAIWGSASNRHALNYAALETYTVGIPGVKCV